MKNDKNNQDLKKEKKDEKPMTENQKKSLFILTVVGAVVMNIGISVFQVLKARRK